MSHQFTRWKYLVQTIDMDKNLTNYNSGVECSKLFKNVPQDSCVYKNETANLSKYPNMWNYKIKTFRSQ